MAWYVTPDGAPVDLDTIRGDDGRATGTVERVALNPDGSLIRTKWAREGAPLRPDDVDNARRNLSEDPMPETDDDMSSEWPGGRPGGGGGTGSGGGLIGDDGAPDPDDPRFADPGVRGYLDTKTGLIYTVNRDGDTVSFDPKP